MPPPATRSPTLTSPTTASPRRVAPRRMCSSTQTTRISWVTTLTTSAALHLESRLIPRRRRATMQILSPRRPPHSTRTIPPWGSMRPGLASDNICTRVWSPVYPWRAQHRHPQATNTAATSPRGRSPMRMLPVTASRASRPMTRSRRETIRPIFPTPPLPRVQLRFVAWMAARAARASQAQDAPRAQVADRRATASWTA